MKRHYWEISILVFIAIVTTSFFFIFRMNNHNEKKKLVVPKNELKPRVDTLSTKVLVDSLFKLEYLKYAIDEDIDSLKAIILSEFDRKYGIPLLYSNDSNICMDYRHYLCDGENIFESNGIPDMLKELQPAFQKRGIKIKVNDYVESYDMTQDWLNEKITINETEYVVFKNFKGYGWGEATFRLAEILNNEFKKQGSVEKIYLTSGGNSGHLFILTNEIFNLLNDNQNDAEWKPNDIYEWAKVNYIRTNFYQ